MNQYVVDASVGAKWLFEEEGADQALGLQEILRQKKVEIIVPELFFIELASVCSMRFKRRMISWPAAVEGIDTLLHLPLTCYSDRELADIALGNALQYKISAYDAMYLSLAELYVVPLITADEDLIRASRKGGFDFIEHLRDVKLS